MPDPVEILIALAAAAGTSAALAVGWLGRRLPVGDFSMLGALGAFVGLFVGCWFLQLKPHWPPAEDRDRFLLIIVPALLIVELVVRPLCRWPVLIWILRGALALLVAPILLHNSIYLANLDNPGPEQWDIRRALIIFARAAALLGSLWAALVRLAASIAGPTAVVALGLVIAGAGVVVMLSGYATGGQMGLVLAASLAGTILVSMFSSSTSTWIPVIGLGVVGLFALLTIGLFFGELSALNAALVWIGACLCWVPDHSPTLRRQSTRVRGILRVVLPLIPVTVALVLAQQEFARALSQTYEGMDDASAQEYKEWVK